MIWLLVIAIVAWVLVGLFTVADPYATLAYVIGSIFGIALALLFILIGVENEEHRHRNA